MSDICEHRMEREWDALPAMAKAYFADERVKRKWHEIELANAALLHAETERDRWLAKALEAGLASCEIAHGTLTLEDGRIRYRPRPDKPYHLRLLEAEQP